MKVQVVEVMNIHAPQFLTPFLRCAMLLCMGIGALSGQAATINFEKLPDNSDPVDDLHLPLDYVFQDGRTGLSFGYDTDGDNIADTGAVIEEHGNTDDVFDEVNVCVAYTGEGGTPRDHDLTADVDGDGYGDGGRWFIREKKVCNVDKDTSGNTINQADSYTLKAGNKFIVTYSNELPTNLAGQMWDLDFGETFLAEVYSEAGALIASKTVGPYCSSGGNNVTLGECIDINQDGLGVDFFFADLPTPAKRLAVSFVRTNGGGGFAFDNFNGTQAFVDVNSPLDPDDDDGDGTSDGNDNCPLDANPGQDDTDLDGVGDVCDICANTPPNSVVVTDPYSPIYGCVDNDGDGVLNGVDQCPFTPANDPVNTDGCTDNDGDGVEDTADQCPSTPAGDPVNNEGCTDTDGDGIGDSSDSCPNTPQGAQVNASGCTDTDGDGVEDGADQCPSTPAGDPVNTDGCTDTDGDGIADGADNCPLIANSDQANVDGDGFGDLCDDDDDGDGIADVTDQCPNTPQGAQVNASGCTDTDGDGVEDGADQCPSTPAGDPVNTDGCTDTDGDGIADSDDNCPVIANSDQANLDGDSVGDACDTDDDGDLVKDTDDQCPNTPLGAVVDSNGCADTDNDGVPDSEDCCPNVSNPGQEDQDGDGIGDVCDDDDDDDGVPDVSDQCPNTPLGAVVDGDGCADTDNDGVPDSEDCCPNVANPGQEDSDGDGIGDACEVQPIPVMGVTSVVLMSVLTLLLSLWWRRRVPKGSTYR